MGSTDRVARIAPFSPAGARRGSAARVAILLLAAILVAAGVTGFLFFPKPPAPPPATAPVPATSPASAPATAAARPPPAKAWIDVVLRNLSEFPTTRPLDFPVDLPDAARLIIHDPVYLCPRGDLWITRDDALPTPTVLRSAVRDQVHVLPDRPVFVHWGVNEAGGTVVTLIVETPDRRLERVTAGGRAPLPLAHGPYAWDRAFLWDGRIVAPCAAGVSLIDVDAATEAFQPLAGPPDGRVRVLLDRRGVLAWRAGGSAARYVDGTWAAPGDAALWPHTGIFELVPLLDGSVLQLIDPGDGTVTLRNVTLDAGEGVDLAAVEALVVQLSDAEAARREAASAELSRYGPLVWPILERLAPAQPPEAQVRIAALLAAKHEPSLGAFRPITDDLRPWGYLSDGGVVLKSEAGVEVASPTVAGETRLVTPGWLAVRPGRSVRMLPAALTDLAMPGRTTFNAWGDEWIAADTVLGPRRLLGNHLGPLVKDDAHRRFTQFVGIDSRGRWLFRPTEATRDTSQPVAPLAAGPTLVIDPFLPDPAPRLPVWNLSVDGGFAGWDEHDWPVQKSGGTWALKAGGWEAMPDGAAIFTVRDPTAAMTSLARVAGPLLRETDGAEWFGGLTSLRRVRPGAEPLDWPLPPEVLGSVTDPVLLRAGDDRLFLFNAPGRVIRLREVPQATGDAALRVEAVFTEQIPINEAQRIWLDPAGRIIIAHGGNKLAILFPSGRPTPEIARLMPARDEE